VEEILEIKGKDRIMGGRKAMFDRPERKSGEAEWKGPVRQKEKMKSTNQGVYARKQVK